MSRRTIVIIVLVVLALVPAVLIFTGVIGRRGGQLARPVSLVWWTTGNDVEALQAVATLYRNSHPYVRITIEAKDPATLDQAAKDGWAKDEGPDLLSLPNDAMSPYQDFLTPAPAQIRVATYRTRQILGRENTEVTYQVDALPTPREVRSSFVNAVGRDVVLKGPSGEAVYGLPLSLDTLLLLVNRDLLSSAGIVEPAATWQGLVEQIPKLTLLDPDGKVVRPAVGIGLAANVPYAVDILTLLMLQNGTRMTDPTNTDVTFHQTSPDGQTPGVGALTFYTDFAQTNPPKESLTWSATQPDALELFAQGKLAYAFAYQRDRVRIAEHAPDLNVLVAPVPHLYENALDNDAGAPAGDQLRTITYGRYLVQAVAKKTGANAPQAWHLLRFAATNGTAAREYAKRTKQPGALNGVLREQQSDPDLTVSATQAPADRSWYHGLDGAKVNGYLAAAIEDVATKGVSAAGALERAAKLVALTLPGAQP